MPPNKALSNMMSGTESWMYLPKVPEVLINKTAKLSCIRFFKYSCFCIGPIYKILFHPRSRE